MHRSAKQLLPHVREQRIAVLEASLRRLDDVDPDEIEVTEYAEIFNELVRLREERDRHHD